METNWFRQLRIGLLVALISVYPQTFAQNTPATTPAMAPAKPAPKASINLDLRYRYEQVDQAGFAKNARASLLRSRLSLSSAERGGLRVSAEIDNVSSLGAQNYNSTENGLFNYPTIADPEGTSVNQLFLRYAKGEHSLSTGRQRILLGNMRFIGAKPWRNNEQTYDGVRLRLGDSSKLSVDMSYVNRVNRIFGPDDGLNPADWKGDNAFMRASYKVRDEHQINAFAYLLDVEPQNSFSAGKTVNNSSDSFGLEYRGSISGLRLHAAWAKQRDAGESELNYSADYYVLEIGGNLRKLQFDAAREVLGSDNNVGFSTPLANGHGYQGWADKFLATPGDGLQDTWISVRGRLGPVALTGRYHDFRADVSSVDFGSEVDLQASWEVSERVTATLKAAFFDSDSPDRYSDTDKVFLVLQMRL